jgi:hypothetical protein
LPVTGIVRHGTSPEAPATPLEAVPPVPALPPEMEAAPLEPPSSSLETSQDEISARIDEARIEASVRMELETVDSLRRPNCRPILRQVTT